MAKKSKTKKLSRGHLPVKRSINLVGVNDKPIDVKIAIPGIILILIAAALIGKFAVADRIAAMNREQQKVAVLQSQISQGYAKIESYGDLNEQYAHYTYSGFTEEEVNRADRVDVISMIRRSVAPKTTVEAWSITENTLLLTVSGTSLQEINLMAQDLEKEDIVDFCTVATASTNDRYYNGYYNVEPEEGGRVTARVTVYLNGPEEEAAF